MGHPSRFLSLLLVAGSIVFATRAGGETPGDTAAEEPPPGEPVEVSVGLYVLDLPKLDQIENAYTITADVQVSWLDRRRVKPGETSPRIYQGRQCVRELEEGWWPQLGLKTLIGSSDQQEDELTVFPDGRIILRRRAFGEVRTPFDFKNFPFDKQTLRLPIEPFTWTDDVVVLVADTSGIGLDEDLSLPEWDVTGIHAEVTTSHNPTGRMSFSRILFTVDIERRIGYYLWKILLPVFTLVVLSWIVFWMTSENLSRRVGVSSTTILTVIAYQFIISSSLPRLAYLTVLDRLVLFSFLTIALTVPVNLIASTPRAQDSGFGLRVDRLCRLLFPLWYGVGIASILFGPWSARG
jgi:hypothetical protein